MFLISNIQTDPLDSATKGDQIEVFNLLNGYAYIDKIAKKDSWTWRYEATLVEEQRGLDTGV